MANYLTEEYRVTNPPSSVDLNVIDKTLSVMQNKYDNNKALIDQTLSLYDQNLKGLRPEDQAYIAQKLTDVKNQINLYSKKNGNLARNYTKDSIMSAITSVMGDPIVQDIVTSTANYTNYQNEVAKIAEKDPSKVTDSNYAYGLHKAGYEDYMQGKIKKLGTVQYTPYTDLQEKHLKDLKTIKDIKGKRFIETVSPDGMYKIRKEIDGLTEDEIENYFEGNLSPQEKQQMVINGWSKYAQPTVEQEARNIYGQFIGQKLRNKETNLNSAKANANNSNLSNDVREANRKKSEELQYEVDSLKNLDVKNLNIEDIAFDLEKSGYVNNLAKVASTEWSQSVDVNDAYFKTQDLEIKRANLEISRENQNMARLRLAKELGIDENGKPITEEQVTQSSIDTELQKEMEEEGEGYASLNKMHQDEVVSIINKGKSFLENASEEDRKAYIANLNKKGLDENLNWINGGNNGKAKSTAVYEAFQEGGFASTYSEYDMSADNERKRTLARTITDVEKDSYIPVFKQKSDEYIDFLNTASSQIAIQAQAENIWTDTENESALKLRDDINSFVTKAGGWNNVKSYLNKNPNQIAEFATLTDRADKEYKGLASFQFKDRNLKEDAKQSRELLIQRKSQNGTVMSSYNSFNFTKPDTRQRILNMVPNERSVGGILERDKDANLTAYKQGENIILTQEQKAPKGETKIVRVVLDIGDAAYNEIAKYVDIKPDVSRIPVTKDFSLSPTRVNLGSFSNNRDTAKKRQYSIQSTLQRDTNLLAPFEALNRSFGIRPTHYATKETADAAVRGVLAAKGVPAEKVKILGDKLFNNINSYKAYTRATNNITATGYKPIIEYKDPQGKVIETIDLGDNLTEVNKELMYLINNHPQIFLLNQILFETNTNNIDEKINSL